MKITDERTEVFIRSFDEGDPAYLEEIAAEALEEGVPIIRRSTRNFIRTLLRMQKPEHILEVGTAVGFSALLFCEYAPPGVKVDTIENYEERIVKARENIRLSGREDQITLIPGDAGEILKSLSGPYDMIFMDAAKAQYINWLPDVLRLLSPGGILLSDNVLQEGDILESHYLVERRDRTIYKRMREYLFSITHHPDLTTSILPVGDGLALSVKNQENRQDTQIK